MAQLYFYYSAMNAGKTTNLLQAAYNYEERNMHVLRLKPSIDNRETNDAVIASRIGLKSDCILFHQEEDLYQRIGNICGQLKHKQGKDISAIFIDEAQFLTREQVKQLSDLVDYKNIPVLCYGLRTDFEGELFPGSMQLLAWADKLVEIKGICHCGKKASMVARYDEFGKRLRVGEQILIGGNDSYVSYCRKDWKIEK